MVEQILNRLSRSIAQVGQETGQFRKAADMQNRSMFSFVKDISKMFTSQNKTQATINNSLDGIENSTQQTSAKVDQSNDLIRESISIQTNMLSELKTLSKGIGSLLGGANENGSLVNTITTAVLAAAGGVGLGAAAMSDAGQNLMSSFGINTGGGGSNRFSNESFSGSSTLASQNLASEEKAILETIASGESSGKYNIINYVGGGGSPKYFESYDNHPFKGEKGPTAAGRYQFLWTTWKNELEAMGEDPNAVSFSPENQDRVAISHAKRIYKQKTGRDLVEDIKNPELHGNITNVLQPTWHGIKGGSYLGSAYEQFKSSSASTPEGDGDMLPMSAASSLQSFSTKDPSHVQGLDGNFQNQLLQFLQAAKQEGHSIRLYSGYRSPERQKELYANAVKKYGSPEAARKWVAPPGRSRHNFGIAADLDFASGEARQWAHQNARRFGMHFRMGHEPWHIEPINASSGNRSVAAGMDERESAADIDSYLGGMSTGAMGLMGAPSPGGGYGPGSPGNSPLDLLTSQLAGIGGMFGPAMATMAQAGGLLMSGLTGISTSNLFNGGENETTPPEGDGDVLPMVVDNMDNRASLLDQNMIQTKAEFPTIPATTPGQIAMNNQGNEPKTGIGNMALNGAQDRDTLADWYRELIGGKIIPDSNFGKTIA
jgi:muramidase (phage lysozyme)